MENIDCIIDTTPMAQSIDGVAKHVAVTTGAVAAMQTAVIAEQKRSADNLCKNVDKGFYGLINSQLSAKRARYFTEMNATFALLLQYSKSLPRAVNRLQRQYYRIFHGIDRSLERRVIELDQPSINLADSREKVIAGYEKKGVGSAAMTGKEGSRVNSLILTGRLKEKTSSAISSIGKNMLDGAVYRHQISTLISDKSADKQEKIYVPVIIALEESQVNKSSSFLHTYFPEYLSEDTRGAIQQALNMSDQTPENDKDNPDVKREFSHLVSESGLDQRTAQTMLSLYGGNLK